VQVEGDASLEPDLADGVEPQAHQRRVAMRIDATAIGAEELSFRDGVQASEQRETFVEHVAHHVTLAGAPLQLETQQGAHGMACWDHLGTRKTGLVHDLIEWHPRQVGNEQEQTAELCPEGSLREIEELYVRDGRGFRPRQRRTFLIRSPRQA